MTEAAGDFCKEQEQQQLLSLPLDVQGAAP